MLGLAQQVASFNHHHQTYKSHPNYSLSSSRSVLKAAELRPRVCIADSTLHRKIGYFPTATRASSRDDNSPPMALAPAEVDQDLYAVLALASDDELEKLYADLFDTSLLSPLGKSLQTPTPPAVYYSGREALIRRIERRFRFLAADAQSTLRGEWPSYRESLLAIHHRLSVPSPTTLKTHDLEAEIFLHLLKEHSAAVDAVTPAASSAAEHAMHGDGMAPPPGSNSATSKPNIFEKALAPLKLGAEEVWPAITRLGATVAVTNLQVGIAQQLGSVFIRRSIQYETAAQLAAVAANSVSSRAAVSAAQRGLTAAAARYGAARSLLSVVGPVMWAVTAVDLARMSIGCDYSRIVKAVFALAQIRLLRTEGWVTKSQCNDDDDDDYDDDDDDGGGAV